MNGFVSVFCFLFCVCVMFDVSASYVMFLPLRDNSVTCIVVYILL